MDDVSFEIYPGETYGLMGESGSGKSVFTKTFVGMLDANGMITGGSIMYEGRDMTKFTEKDWLGVRGKKIAMVMQDPMTSLNPVSTSGNQIAEVIRLHTDKNKADAWARAKELLELVGSNVPEKRLKQYPHELSGGMRQRVMIAMALANHPDLLIADEPTTALDVTIQHQILKQMRSLQEEYGTSIIFITHDLTSITYLCDDVLFLYLGRVTENLPVERISETKDEYARKLLESIVVYDTEESA